MLGFSGKFFYILKNDLIFIILGLTADARVLIDFARVECQNYRLAHDDPVAVGYISRFIANTKQVILSYFLFIKFTNLFLALYSITWSPSFWNFYAYWWI